LARAQDEIALDTRSRIQPRAITPGENGSEGDENTSACQWAEAISQDSIYNDTVTALEEGARKFPPTTGIKEVFNYVQARMAEAQQTQEIQTNHHRQEAPIFQVRDRVWLRYEKSLSNGKFSQ
jgi:hypothetical protein